MSYVITYRYKSVFGNGWITMSDTCFFENKKARNEYVRWLEECDGDIVMSVKKA